MNYSDDECLDALSTNDLVKKWHALKTGDHKKKSLWAHLFNLMMDLKSMEKALIELDANCVEYEKSIIEMKKVIGTLSEQHLMLRIELTKQLN